MATIFRAIDTQLGREVARQAAAFRVPARPRLLVALPPGGAERRVAEPPQRRQRVRLRRGPVWSVHRHGARRRRGPRDDPAAQRRPAAQPGGAHRGGGRAGTRGGACPRHRPPRREARQRADRAGRAGQGRRLRDRAGGRRGPGDAARHDARFGPLLQPGAGPRRDRDRRRRTSTRSASSCTRCSTGPRPWEGDSAARSHWPGSAARCPIRPAPDPRCRPTSPRSPARRSHATPERPIRLGSAMADALEGGAGRGGRPERSRGSAGAGGRRSTAQALAGAAGLGRRSGADRTSGRSHARTRRPGRIRPMPTRGEDPDVGDREPIERPRRRPPPPRTRTKAAGTSPVVWLAGHRRDPPAGRRRLLRLPVAVRAPAEPPPGAGRRARIRRHAPRRCDPRGGATSGSSSSRPSARPTSRSARSSTRTQPVTTVGRGLDRQASRWPRASRQVPMPDLRNKTVAQAVQEIVAAGLTPGIETKAFDPVVPRA